MSMTVLRKHVNILNGFNKVKQQTEDTSEGNMKHLKLGKIQWIALLVVSAMFVNLCSHMVLAAARDGNDPAQGTTAEATTASEATTETTTEQQEETQSMGEYKAFWFSFYDYDSYRAKYKKRTAANFRTYFTGVVKKGKSLGMNRVIVQVRPFGDAIYKSKYFPWSKYISGKQGRNPGFDPLKIMVEVTHDNDMKIEAWVNPYRVTTGSTNYKKLAKNNQARKWHAKKSTRRNVLSYGGSLYYNPSKKAVRTLITNGVKEIVQNYNVDGIHMDDYFYPSFTEKNVTTAFDAPEYKQQLKTNLSSTDSTSLTSADKSSNEISLADWRRDNVNRLVSGIYKAVKEINSDVTFGISPAGNLDNLRSDLEYYVDIDTWVSQNGYVDYLMPQIYWGFTNEVAPFDKVTDAWCILMENSPVKLYIGLQLYRMGSTEPGQSDEKELQKTSLLKKELSYLKKQKKIEGYCLFSYQYLDCQNKKYHFDAEQFSTKRKKLLNQIVKSFKNNS